MNEAINKHLHEKVMGECWHIPDKSTVSIKRGVRVANCLHCSETIDVAWVGWDSLLVTRCDIFPDYCTDLNAMSRVEKKIEELDIEIFMIYLDWIKTLCNEQNIEAITAPAPIRARAAAIVTGYEEN